MLNGFQNQHGLVVKRSDRNAGGQVPRNSGQSLLHVGDGLQGVPAVLLLDGDIDGFTPVVPARLPPEFRPFLNVGDIADAHRDIPPHADHGVPDILEDLDPAEPLDQDFLGSAGDDAAGKIPVGLLEGLPDLVHGDAVIAQTIGLQENLELPDVAPEIDDE